MRKGSALLIVLGMLAFMVVSAIGFSIYMRESRVPSSHLRRESTARYLLKSALANAITRLDGAYNAERGRLEGVYDDAYPGVTRENLAVQDNGGYWSHRIFMPFGPVASQSTVSTLTLEGLAYLPPAIINEARAFSRMTRTAQWSNLSYDLGRYAFCAIDVSDCFDINKLYAGERRTSAAGERITLASLYPTKGSTLDDLFDKAGSVPFVSLADFNITAGDTDFTPFYGYIGSSGAKIYTESDAQAVSNALFITDTWFPATNDYLTADLERKSVASSTPAKTYDLGVGAGKTDQTSGLASGQPFNDFSASSFLYVSDQAPPTRQGGYLLSNLGGVGLACLYDYLDADQEPITLALPTTEAVPMVCGFSLVGAGGGLSPKFEKTEGVDGFPFQYVRKDSKGIDRTVERRMTKYAFRGMTNTKGVRIAGVATYPFKRMKSTGRATSGSYKLETLVAMFYATDDMKSRLENEAFRPTKAIWDSPGPVAGVCWYKGSPTQLSVPGDVKTTEEAMIQFTVSLEGAASEPNMPVLYKVNEEDKTDMSKFEDTSALGKLELVNDRFTVDSLGEENAARFRPFDRNGEEIKPNAGNYNNKLFVKADFDANPNQDQKWDNAPGGEYRLYFAVWLRVTDGDGKTVDMAPATFSDDGNWIEGCNYGKLGNNPKFDALGGGGCPLLDFRAGDATKMKYDAETLDGLENGAEVEFTGWKALYAVDPRYNFAPEDWFGANTEYSAKMDWYNLVSASLGGNRRDHDIFMFTSDQEYLQSIGELQFLPYVQRLGRSVSFLECDFADAGRYNGNNDFGSRGPGSLNAFANGDRLWTTYSAIAADDTDRNPYFDLYENGQPVTVVSGTGDFRVNPFSPDSRILSAAILDTPYDFYVASTNDNCNKNADMTLAQARQLAFGENGKLERWESDEVADLAARLRNAFGEAGHDGVTDAREAMSADYLNWESSNPQSIFNISEDLADPLHGVDRKFLYSYWAECFQNRQQLFLVFIRAEPLTVGGSTGDAIASAQLGARGVALVWRDPAPPKTTGDKRKGRQELSNREAWREQCERSGPHRTRVLFYHQFD